MRSFQCFFVVSCKQTVQQRVDFPAYWNAVTLCDSTVMNRRDIIPYNAGFVLVFMSTCASIQSMSGANVEEEIHDNVIKWKLFPRYCPFARGIHRPPVDFPHKGQWRGALVFSLICAWTNSWANNGDCGDLRCHCAHYDVTLMYWQVLATFLNDVKQIRLFIQCTMPEATHAYI